MLCALLLVFVFHVAFVLAENNDDVHLTQPGFWFESVDLFSTQTALHWGCLALSVFVFVLVTWLKRRPKAQSTLHLD